MSLLRRYRLLIRAATALVVAGIAVRVQPRRVLRHLQGASSPADDRRPHHHEPQDIAWAIAAVSRRLPGTRTCLVQALAAEALLVRDGYPARVHIGVRPTGGPEPCAHAWVELHGQVIVGGNPGSFAPLPLHRLPTFLSHACPR